MARPDPRQTSIWDILDAAPPAPVPAQPEPPMVAAPVVTPEQTLIEARLAHIHELRQGRAIWDRSVPQRPRSLSQPLRFERGADGIPHLYLSTPACAGLAFVRRIEALTGLKAIWDEDRRMPPMGAGEDVRFAHAFDLARDEGWERLAATLEHTTMEDVDQAVAQTVTWGLLSPANARALLLSVGLPEPEGRSVQRLKVIQPAKEGRPAGIERCGAWAVVHALEDEWYRHEPQTRGRLPLLRFTPEGYRRLGMTPPAKAA
jgi:hypothetical protein